MHWPTGCTRLDRPLRIFQTRRFTAKEGVGDTLVVYLELDGVVPRLRLDRQAFLALLTSAIFFLVFARYGTIRSRKNLCLSVFIHPTSLDCLSVGLPTFSAKGHEGTAAFRRVQLQRDRRRRQLRRNERGRPGMGLGRRRRRRGRHAGVKSAERRMHVVLPSESAPSLPYPFAGRSEGHFIAKPLCCGRGICVDFNVRASAPRKLGSHEYSSDKS